ncbi:protein NRT1/ PTR FAMILY 4.5-like [Carica papaya]|uniref:protein NRT1/ PTR FAMILY 4.5-like n=1 Tax=Carica papaya TaxID=3649 RepID=UPI000B8C9B43|nr:protein NRT1/ PTR FAMILY 4.5-like [Carica papaya]
MATAAPATHNTLLTTGKGPEVTTKADCETPPSSEQKGGFRASMFIFVLVALENMGFIANMVSMYLYFYNVMHFSVSGAANTLTNFLGTTFLLTVVGGFISDTYLNRFTTCLLFGALEVLALVMVTIQAHSDHLHPSSCGKTSCVKGGIAVMLHASLGLLALGAGGVKGSLPPLGADQFDQKNPKEEKALASFFNFLLLSTTLGAVVGVTGIVWVSTKKAWYLGFTISTVAAFVGFIVLAIGKNFYRLLPPIESPLIRIAQVIVVAIKNRKLTLPDNADELYEIIDEKEQKGERISHTNQFRWLDKAAILHKNKESTKWVVCSVTQVEEVKIITRMLPILGSTIIMNTCLAQLQTFSMQQGSTMESHLGSLEVPTPSIPVIPLVFMSILVPIYEYGFVPFARKITNHPSGITQLQRVGIGLVLSIISMGVSGIIEVKRRNQSIKNRLQPISLFWLSFQYAIFGIADMFTLVGLLEFFYKEAPTCMKSLSTSFTWLSLSFGYFLSSVFVEIINSVTRRITPNRQGWLYGLDIDKNHVDLFYWFLAILSSLNFINYLYWASWYKYKSQDPNFESQLQSSTEEEAAPNHNVNIDQATTNIEEAPSYEKKGLEKDINFA